MQEGAACWGAELHGGAGCTPYFVPGKLHFKNKFCDNCRNCVMVPLEQLRALSEDQAACVVNKRSEGFWNSAPANMGGGQYRILNNTAGCVGPWLALFREQPPMIQWRDATRFDLILSTCLILTFHLRPLTNPISDPSPNIYNPPSPGRPYPSNGAPTMATYACVWPRGRWCLPRRCAAANRRSAKPCAALDPNPLATSPPLCPNYTSTPTTTLTPTAPATATQLAPSPLTPSVLPSAPPPSTPTRTALPMPPSPHPQPGQASAKRRKVLDEKMHTALYEA